MVLYLKSDSSSAPSFTVPTKFSAYEYTSYGDPLDQVKLVAGIPMPKKLKRSYVRIRVHSAALNPVDYKIAQAGFNFFPVGPSPDAPFRIGFDAAGTVVEVGGAVEGFKIGDLVYTMTPFSGFGTIAQYLDVDAKYVAPKPEILSFDQAASIPLAGLTSFQSLVSHGKIQKGSRVLILGGSGGTGTYAIQIAKALGAYVITTTSFRNAEFVKSLGADEVIDYTKEKWVDVVDAHSIDVLYDCGMEPASWNNDAQKVLKKDTGHFVTILDIPNPIESPIGTKYTRVRVQASGTDLQKLTEFVEKGQLVSSIDSVYPFGNLLDAVTKVKSGRARGKVIIHVYREREQRD
uniref:Enoyl reductase (ER) domain-containing protein n=1 Tax=Globisporangium ultimum (strain ATCC 200006 / CBS 805.95 / DAOM BR144) TaxID=431595 RepID=K3WJC7_GLOUD